MNENIHEELQIGGLDGSMDDEYIEFQTATTQYLGIEEKVTPELFYDLSALTTNDKFRPVKIHARIGIIAYTLLTAFRMEAMKMSEADMLRGLICLGLIALCKQKNINLNLIEPTIKLYLGQRQVSMDKRFEAALELLDFDSVSTIQVVNEIVSGRPQNDKYGVLLWSRLHKAWSREKPRYIKTRAWTPSRSLINKCKAFVKAGMSDKIYELKNKSKNNSVDSQNPNLTIRISRRFAILSYEYSKFYATGKLPGQLYRGYLNAGLYVLSKWLIQKKLSNYEFEFKKMIHELEIQACVKQSKH